MNNLYLTSSFRYPGVAELVMDDIEKQLQKSPSDIKVAYITTAGNLHPADQRDWIDDGRKLLQGRGWQVCDLDIADKSRAEVEAEISSPDVLFVQGGQCICMLEQVQRCQFDQIVSNLLAQGVLYIGESTGSIITGQNIDPYRFLAKDRRANPPVLDSYQGMGLVNFLIRPHWNNPSKKTKYLTMFSENLEQIYQIDQPMIFLNDNQLVRVKGDSFQICEV